jgi:hypothetical protein
VLGRVSRQLGGRAPALVTGLALVALTLVAASVLSEGAPASVTLPSAACGIERWTVKTLQDRPRLLPVRNASIAYLVSRRAPATLPAMRFPFERSVFRVTAAVTVVRAE